jgi:hypothetical protein
MSARLAGGGAPHRAYPDGGRTMNAELVELGVLVLTAISFWLLDRYVIGCEKI